MKLLYAGSMPRTKRRYQHKKMLWGEAKTKTQKLVSFSKNTMKKTRVGWNKYQKWSKEVQKKYPHLGDTDYLLGKK